MVASPPQGIYVPVPTFFVSKSASNYDPIETPIDHELQAKHSVYLAQSGIKGLVILGSTGEAVHLTNKERNELLRSQRDALEKAGFKDYPIMAGTASASIPDVIEQLKGAKEAGSQWGMCLAPGYFGATTTQGNIADWFTAVADRSPIPILVYHYPGVSNNIAITPATMEKLAQHPNIVGCKLSHGAMDDHLLIALNPKIDHEKWQTFSGLGQHLLPFLSVGGAGVIDGLASAFPKTVVRLFNLFHEGDISKNLKEMRELQYKISGGEKLVVGKGVSGIREMVARMRGFGDKDGGRVPLKGGMPNGDADWEPFKGVMEALDEVERSL